MSFVAASLCCVFDRPASGQQCPLTFPASPGNDLTSYITVYPYYNTKSNVQQQLISYFIVDVTNTVSGANPPIPYGLYPTWCVDEWDFIFTASITVPGSNFTGALYSTCDPDLNSELPPSHTNTLVSPATWQMVNYILNHQDYNGSRAFWWDVQTAINNLVGNGVGSVDECGKILTTPAPDGVCGWPTNHPTVVQALLTAAADNAPSWIPQCGDVYGAIYVIQPLSSNIQFIMLEVPIPCSPCIGVTKKIACFQPGGTCGQFGPVAEGFVGANCSGAPDSPAFCYEITVTNCGTIPLTNVTVTDNLLGNLTTHFFTTPSTVFEPGASATAYFSMAFATNATNTVTVQGAADLAGTVTNGSVVITNGTPVENTASATALVTPASISCALSLSSPFVAPANNGGATLILPEILPSEPAVTVSLTVANTGASALNNVTITVPTAIQGLSCTAPAPFSLAVGQSQTFQLCSDVVSCPVNQTFTVTVTGVVESDLAHCGVYDLTGSPITVCCSSLGTVECSTNGGCTVPNELSGTVALDCVVGSTSLAGDTGLSGWTVLLYGSAGVVGSPLATNTTDINGNYSFASLGTGTYTVVVTPPAGYVETYPVGVTSSQQQVSVTACQNSTGVNFGYANTTPPQFSVTPGQNLGCNPTYLPSDNDIATSNVTVTAVYCGTPTVKVTHLDSTNNCLVTRTFTIVVSDTYGNSATNYVTYSWTANQTPPTINGTPGGGNLGCNPAAAILPTASSVTNGMSASNACGSASLSVTNVLSTNGCTVSNVYTITATDGCGNTASTNVVYTWTANLTPPTINGTPGGANLGCNPAAASLPTCSSVTNDMSASTACGSASLSVSNMLATNGCTVSDTFYITAVDTCGNTALTNVTYTWTAATLAITGMPSGGALGCNPARLPTDASVSAGVSYAETCSTMTNSVTHQDTTNGCTVTRIFTINAGDTCGDTVSTNVTYTWTVATLAFSSVPSGGPLGCNPASLPTDASVSAGVTYAETCSTMTNSVTHQDTTNGCTVTRVFTINAGDACSDTVSTTVTYTWMANTTPPTITGVPTNAFLGCNGATNLPSDTTVSNEVRVTSTCGTAAYTVTHVDATNGCLGTRIFTITASETCGNTATATVTYSWTVNGVGPTITCPTNVTIVTNICQMYCTFTCGDWGGSCNGGYPYNNNWWQHWCSQNPPSESWPSWVNWWNSCGGNNNQCANFWNCWNNSHPTNWWGGWSGQQSGGNWWSSWNGGNGGKQQWVPCGGNNPDSILSSCFNQVYPNGCVTIGQPGGNCLTLTSCSAVQTCLNFGGNPGVLNGSFRNPTSCSAGSFCAQVLALRLNCDFGDYGCAPGFVGKCGDLVLCDPTSPCNGCKVRDILTICNCALGGGSCPQGCTVQYLCGLCGNLNQCFEGCQVSGWCSTHLCCVYIPSPAVTGTPAVTDACSPNPTVTYCDTVSTGSCPATYVISREWIAVDACGNSNTCRQLITVAQSNSCAVSGLVVLAGCSGDTNLCNKEGISNVVVTLENSQGTPIEAVVTGANGGYSFGGLAPGSYIVVVTPPSGYTETYPAAGGNNQADVTLAPCQCQAGVNFAYTGSTPGVQLIKTAPCIVPCGGTIAYTFAVTNTGNTCETLSVLDPLLGGTIFSQTGVEPGQGFLFRSNFVVGLTAGILTNTASAIGTASNGKSATNTSTVVTTITTEWFSNGICCNFNSQNPGGGWVWCNAHISCNPGKKCTVFCQGASVTLTCNDGHTYTYPVPDCQINFSPTCSTGSSAFDGTKWSTTLPCGGDDEVFLSGCGIPWQSDFANCHSVCWNGTFSCDTAGISCNWQWSAACYNENLGNCGSINVKPCHNVPCGYPGGDHAGTPENCKPFCQGGACGGGGGNYTGSWSGTGSCSFTSCR